jgi:hypothetical protein
MTLQEAEEQRAELDAEATDDENGEEPERQAREQVAQLRPKEIRDYVLSLNNLRSIAARFVLMSFITCSSRNLRPARGITGGRGPAIFCMNTELNLLAAAVQKK